MDTLQQLSPWFEQFSYVAVFVVLVLCGVGLPIPEEVTFIAAGYVVNKAGASIWLMIAVAVVGILAGDSLTFILGRKLGAALLRRRPFTHFVSGNGLEKARGFFDRHGSKAVFMAGFLAGVRAPTFFLCGSMGLSYLRFLFWDLARAVLTCPISVWAGYMFGEGAEEFLRRYSHWVLGGLALVALVLAVRWLVRRQRVRARQAGVEGSTDTQGSGKHLT